MAENAVCLLGTVIVQTILPLSTTPRLWYWVLRSSVTSTRRTKILAEAPETGAFALPTPGERGLHIPHCTAPTDTYEHMQCAVSFSRSAVPLELLGQWTIPVGKAALLPKYLSIHRSRLLLTGHFCPHNSDTLRSPSHIITRWAHRDVEDAEVRRGGGGPACFSQHIQLWSVARSVTPS